MPKTENIENLKFNAFASKVIFLDSSSKMKFDLSKH